MADVLIRDIPEAVRRLSMRTRHAAASYRHDPAAYSRRRL
jgi:hypothetical protein